MEAEVANVLALLATIGDDFVSTSLGMARVAALTVIE